MKKRVSITALCLLISIPILFGGWACAQEKADQKKEDKMTAAQVGAIGGGVLGVVAGALLGGGKGALIGAGVGALGGALTNDALKKGK